MIRHSVFSMVDFPEPLEPIKVVMLPSGIFKSSPLKTASPLYPADKPFACIRESIDTVLLGIFKCCAICASVMSKK